ncbi:MAG: metallophosphoesterase family protein [Chloroflexota bacterium]
MKFAVFSDVHGNLPALQAVAADVDKWGADFTVVNGDVINRGPLPAACWDFVQARAKNDGWHIVRGNHEEYVLNHLNPEKVDKVFQMSLWTLSKIRSSVDQLLALPEQWSKLDERAGELRVTHASMAGSRIGIYPTVPSTSIETFRPLIDPPPSVLCVGHTHLPMIKMIDDTLVINSGSAGQPCYGEKKACYAQVTWHKGGWEAEIVRVPYDRKQTQLDWFDSGIFDETSLITRLIYHEWRTALPLLLKWFREYVPQGTAGLHQQAENHLIESFLESMGMLDISLDDRL